MEDIVKYLEELKLKLLKIEENKEEKSKDIIEWVTEIINPKFNLADKIINLLSDPVIPQKTIDEYYHILRNLIKIFPDTTMVLLLNEELHRILSTSILNGKIETLSVDLFYVFTKTYLFDKYKNILNENFIVKLFDSLSVIGDEEIFESLVNILLDICSYEEDINNNLFLNIYIYHDNSRIIDETLLRLLNNEKEEVELTKLIGTVNKIMKKLDRIVFYSSDLEVFIDIILNIIGSPCGNELKNVTLDSIDKITKSHDYYRDMYKLEDLNEIIESILDSDDFSEELKEKADAILENINGNI